MRYALVFLIFATPLSASWWPGWSQTDVQMYVGDRVRIRVTPMWSGLVDYGGGVHWTFASDNPAVATGSVSLESTAPQDFDVVGVSPGFAHIRQNGNGFSYVTIRVACAPEYPAVAAQPVVHAELGREIHLTVVTEFENRATFRWYLGNIGDTSHPLGRSSADATYTPDSYGTKYIWAEVTTVCSTSHVQFRVDVYGRQRAVRH
jgi:hypothetical protein